MNTAALVDRLDETIREAAAADQQLSAYITRPWFGEARRHFDALHHAYHTNCHIIANQLGIDPEAVTESFGCEFGPDYAIEQVRNSLITEADPNPIGRYTKPITVWLDSIDACRQRPGWNPWRRLRVEEARRRVEWAEWRLSALTGIHASCLVVKIEAGRKAGANPAEIAQSIVDYETFIKEKK